MKLRLDVSSERYDELAGELRGLGIEIDEGAGLVLSEVGRMPTIWSCAFRRAAMPVSERTR